MLTFPHHLILLFMSPIRPAVIKCHLFCAKCAGNCKWWAYCYSVQHVSPGSRTSKKDSHSTMVHYFFPPLGEQDVWGDGWQEDGGDDRVDGVWLNSNRISKLLIITVNVHLFSLLLCLVHRVTHFVWRWKYI